MCVIQKICYLLKKYPTHIHHPHLEFTVRAVPGAQLLDTECRHLPALSEDKALCGATSEPRAPRL